MPSPIATALCPPAAAPADRRWLAHRGRILQHLMRRGQTSRRDLALELGLRPNTVGEIVSALIAEGLVEEVGMAGGGRGRRRRVLALSSRAVVLGAELFEGTVRVGAVNMRGELLHFRDFALADHRRAHVLATLVRGLRALGRECRVRGVGVAVAGVVDSARGISRQATCFDDWRDVPLAEIVRAELQVPVAIGNVTNARLAQLRHAGAIAPGMTAALVVLEPGAVGCGVVTDGQILRGAVETSSELGHTALSLDGPRCRCGQRGCLEAHTAWPHLQAALRRRGGAGVRDFAAFARSSASAAVAVRGELADLIGLALANLVHLVKPSRLWLTGALVETSGALTEAIITAMRRRLLPVFSEPLEVEVLEHGPEDGVRGAACLILDGLLVAPRGPEAESERWRA